MGLYLGKEKISNVASAITQNADSMATEIQNHIANSDIHITDDERTKWNTVTEMQNHITDTDIHITADERTKWNEAAENTDNFASTGLMDATVGIDMNSGTIKRCWGINLMDISGNNMNISYDPDDPNYSIKLHATKQESRDIRLTGLAAPTKDTDAANKHYVDSKALPTPSATDNGKVLSVVNGAWAAAAMSSGAYVGSYVGNGASSKTLTFNFKPGMIIMLTIGNYSYMYVSVRGCNKIDRIGGGSGGGIDQGDITWNNTSIVLTSNNYCSISDNNCTYYYAVIPAMN